MASELLHKGLSPYLVLTASALMLVGCNGAKLPDCIAGKPAPTETQTRLWHSALPATSLELAIDGSTSMLGLTGSPRASGAWKALIQGVSLGAAANGLKLQTQRTGSGSSTPVASPMLATDACFFRGCGSLRPVSSSLDSHWRMPGLGKGKPPLRMAISDLEVNDGDIDRLFSAIKAHVDEGAVIAILAVRLPFNGKVYDSQARVIHNGEARRPIYLLATGQQAQLHSLLTEVKTKASLAGVPADAMQLTFLEDQANAPTRTARSVVGIPPQSAMSEVPIRIAGNTYSPNQVDYQFAKLFPGASGVLLSSGIKPGSDKLQPTFGLMQLETIPLAGGTPLTELGVEKLQISGADLTAQIRINDSAPPQAVRAFIPRGQLPEDWWIDWNRQGTANGKKPDQTDGLLLLLTSLSRLMIAPGTTPAASLCLGFSH